MEVSYLTVDKSRSYRTVLQYERMLEFLFPEEIYKHLMLMGGFEGYTEEELHRDSDQLI